LKLIEVEFTNKAFGFAQTKHQTNKRKQYLVSYSVSDSRGFISIFQFDEADTTISDRMVLIISQSFQSSNSLHIINENPIQEDQESLSYHGVSFMRSAMIKEKEAYAYSLDGSMPGNRDDLKHKRLTLAQSKTSTAARETVTSSSILTHSIKSNFS
jgi:hypothetical protein